MIVVYGHKRAGTSWLGEMLGLAVPYLGEVFSTGRYGEHPSKKYVALLPHLRSMVPTGDASLTLEPHVKAWLEHLAPSSREYIVKIPHPDLVSWFSSVFHPDHVVRIHRHPLGILNSYLSNPEWAEVNIRLDWHRHLWFAPGDTAHSDVERLLKSIERQSEIVIPGELPVEYEALCTDPERQYRWLYGRLGLTWSDDIWERMQPMIHGDETDFRSVKKTSIERAYAWKEELPLNVLGIANQVMRGD